MPNPPDSSPLFRDKEHAYLYQELQLLKESLGADHRREHTNIRRMLWGVLPAVSTLMVLLARLVLGG